MNKEVDGVLDMVITILTLIALSALVMWASSTINKNVETTVHERTSVYNEIGTMVHKPVLGAEDALMIFAVADAFTPDPKNVTLNVPGAQSQNVIFDTNYIENRESILNKLWSDAFKGNMGKTVDVIGLNKDATCWNINIK